MAASRERRESLHVRSRVCLFGLGLATFVAFRILAGYPDLVEAAYGGGLAAFVVPLLSRITGTVPFSLVEPVVGAYLLWRGWTMGKGVLATRRGERTPGDLLLGGGLVSLRDLGVGVTLFYLLWGFHYARLPFSDRLGLASLDRITADELAGLARESVTDANRRYRELHGLDDAGRPTRMPEETSDLHAALHRGWTRASAELSLPPAVSLRYGRPKALTLSPLLVRMGLVGFYFPFTAEAVVNGDAPAVVRGRAVSHEQAHQRGVTSEGEATFLGWLAATRSGHPLLRYSAAVDAQGRLLGLLRRTDRQRWRQIADARLPGVVRDLAEVREFHERSRGALSDATTRVNDAYLRANRVEAGVADYGTATSLLLQYLRTPAGTARTDDPAVPSAADGSR